MKQLGLLIFISLLYSIGTHAQTIYVNSSTGNDLTGDGSTGNPYKTFHKGYTEVSSGGTLDLTGTFTWTDADETGDAATDGFLLNKNITIQGQGAGSTIIQAASSAGTADRRIFTINSSYTITIRGLNLRHGNLSNSGQGGAIRVGSVTTDITIENCIIENNQSNNGSYSYSYGGGAIYIYNSNSSGGDVIISNTIIRDNTSSNCWGGAIYHYRGTSGSSSAILENSTICNNTAANGTALAGYYGAYNIINSTITANNGSTTIIMSNHGYGMLYMTNVTFAHNELGVSGRGLYLENVGDIGIKNSILAQNKRTDNSLYDYYRTSGTLNESTNNIIEMQGSSDFTNGVNGNIIGEQDCLGLTNTLADNGTTGISQTLALSASSVAINGGTTTANGSVTIPTSDQRGTARVDLPDIGAYEFTGTPATPEIIASETNLNGFSYIAGYGPSGVQTFTVSGINLVNDITVVPTTYYEISNGGAYGASVVLNPTGGTITETTIYTRLKAGYSIGTYNGSITASTDCDETSINLTGSVSAEPPSTRIWTGNTNSDWNTGSNWSGSTVPTSTWHALIPASATNWPEIDNSLASPALCNNLIIESGAQCTILENAGITVSGNLENNGNMHINSSTTGEGSLLVNGSLSGSGTYNVQRYLPASQWHLVTSPITAGTAGVFENIWLRPYDESTNTFGDYITPTATPMPTGQGFSVWANENETRTFSGTINHGTTGSLNAQLTGIAGPDAGWNLMGNPYPSSIDWDAASGWTKTGLNNTVYVWNSTQYATYVSGVGVNGGSRYIAPGQGFFVQANAAGASLSMNNNVRVHNGVNFMKSTNNNDTENVIRIQINGNEYSDEAVIAIREANSEAFDPMSDAYKLTGSSDAPQMYISKDDMSKLSIASFNNIEDIENKSININYAQENEHNISWAHTLSGSLIPVLIDQITGQSIEAGVNYTYSASNSDQADRFIFSTDPLKIEDNQKEITIWENNNILHINTSETDNAKICIFNIHGVKIIESCERILDLNHLTPGMYIVNIQSGNKNQTEKIILK